jgi:predicted acylesterase/phospholipase RssA
MDTVSTALVIAGGGAKGAFAVGAVRRLYERYRDDGWFSIVGGSSTGAIIAPFAALLGTEEAQLRDRVLEDLVTVYSTVRTQDILSRHGPVESLVRRHSLNETDPLEAMLERYLTVEYFDVLRRPTTATAFVVYTNFNTGDAVRVTSKDVGIDREAFIRAILASASVPVVMEPTIINGAWCYDGGARDVLPMMQAIEMGAEVIVPILLDPKRLPPVEKPLSRIDRVLYRAVAIMLDEILLNDYEMAAMVQRGVRLREALRREFAGRPRIRRRIERILDDPELEPLLGDTKQVRRIVPGIRPPEGFTGNGLRFDPEQMKEWMAQGAAAADLAVTRSPFDDRIGTR